MLKLELLYYPESTNESRPIRVASISDGRLMARAARTAIREAESTANELSGIDHGLASMQHAEIGRLRMVLELFVPEMKSPTFATAT